MPEEKIGSDVLDHERPASRMDKRKQELMEKAKKEFEKKKRKELEEEEEKLPILPIPGEKPPEMSEEEWQELQMRARLTGQLLEEEEKKKTVHVDEHLRSKPKKKKKSLADTVFEFP